MTSEEVHSAVRAAFGESARVETKRPGLYQLHVPMFLSDGDGSQIFLRVARSGALQMTDLGQTCMRLSYLHSLTDEARAEIAAVADRQGFELKEDRLVAEIGMRDLVAGALGLAQVEAVAEAAITARARRRAGSDNFRQIVRQELGRIFPEAQFDFHARDDANSKYSVDAMLKGTSHWLGIAIIPSGIEAERAVIAAHYLDGRVPGSGRWVALPRDINQLPDKSRVHLMDTFLVPIPQFADGKNQLSEKLSNLLQ
jgi:hypothetical protein